MRVYTVLWWNLRCDSKIQKFHCTIVKRWNQIRYKSLSKTRQKDLQHPHKSQSLQATKEDGSHWGCIHRHFHAKKSHKLYTFWEFGKNLHEKSYFWQVLHFELISEIFLANASIWWIPERFYRRSFYSKQRVHRRYPRKGKKTMHWPGIEPGPPAWQARILPLNHQCTLHERFP